MRRIYYIYYACIQAGVYVLTCTYVCTCSYMLDYNLPHLTIAKTKLSFPAISNFLLFFLAMVEEDPAVTIAHAQKILHSVSNMSVPEVCKCAASHALIIAPPALIIATYVHAQRVHAQ